MPSIIYNDDIEAYDQSYTDYINETSPVTDSSTPGTTPTVPTIPVSDGTTRSLDGWIKNTTPSGGTAGETYTDTAPVEKSPLQYRTKTIKEKTRVVIRDYSASYLQSLNDQGFKFFVVYTDGTENEVTYSEIYNPYQSQSSTYVNEALDIANAINQNFWTDTNGVHVTDISKENWDTGVSNSFSDLSNSKQYHNILMNSLGVLLRSALNNLVSLSRSGMTIYDGTGNTLSDILAIFGSTGASFREGGKTKATITTQGLTVYDNSGSVSNNQETYGNQVAFIGVDGAGKPYSRIGRSDKSFIEIGVNSTDRGYIDFYSNTVNLAHIGYDTGINATGGTSVAPYYTFGLRKSDSTIGNYSMAEGYQTTASSYVSHAEGYVTTASGYHSHAEGRNTTASTDSAHAEGAYTTASGYASHASGWHTTAGYSYQFVCGSFNRNVSSDAFEVGNGSAENSRKNAFAVTSSGGAYIAGTTSSNGTTVTSDARLKTLHHVLDPEESSQFIQTLTPKMYYKNGVKEMGFYAQDVEIIPTYGSILVTKDNSGQYDFPNFRLLNYQGLIAPTISALQHALNEINILKQEIEELKNN